MSLPLCARDAGKLRMHSQLEAQAIAAGQDSTFLRKKEAGWLEFFSFRVDRSDATLILVLDDQKIIITPAELDALNMVYPQERFPWLVRYDVPNSVFVVAYQCVMGERYHNLIDLIIKAPAGFAVNIRDIFIKRRVDASGGDN